MITLSASYLAFPNNLLNSILIKPFSKLAACKVDEKSSYIECSSSNKKNIEKIIQKNLIFEFGEVNMMIPLQKLIISNDHGKKIVLNIKQSFNNVVVLG